MSSKQRSWSSWLLFPCASLTQLHTSPKDFEKVQACPQAPVSFPSREPHSSCSTAQAVSSPQMPVLWGRLSRKQSLSRCGILCPSWTSRGPLVPFFFSQASLQLLPLPSQPNPSLSSQISPPVMGSREDFHRTIQFGKDL